MSGASWQSCCTTFWSGSTATSPGDICTSIIALLKAAGPLKSFKQWFLGEPAPSKYPGFPWGWVEWIAGAKEAPVSVKAQVRDVFYVVFVSQHVDASIAEASGLQLLETIETVLTSDRSLGGKVEASWVSNREKEKKFQGEQSMIAVRITVQTRRRE
jgi:hypothetical protein